MNAGVPSGVVTFLFTDIEGSTRRWESDADAMQMALAAHDDVLRDAVESHDGLLFKHTGDGICAAFGSPRAAVDAAITAQRKLDLPVRMGIATGEAELREGDYFGAVLNRAARVMSAGHGGQILLDGATAELLTGLDLLALGPRQLRDIVKPVAISQVCAPGLGTDFPPLRTLDSTPGNLRPPTTSLIGRDAELADLQTALKAHRLVTLTGVGGVGKTRLALELAARSAHGLTDGVFVIELAAVSDPAAVPEAVAAALGIVQQAGMSMASSVAAALEDRTRLLLFDNCEHVLDAAADLIEAILARSDTVRILATSREGLRVVDEQLWPVPPLDTGRESAASELFIQRAGSVAPGISLGEAADAVVEICRRLDGIPLGIELAASRMQSMTVTEVRDRLDDRFRLLVGSRRGLERHQTLRHAVQWSYDLLGDAERSLLQRCSVFSGGFDLTGACALMGSDDEYSTLDLLDALVRKSLLVADRSRERTRFSMLETIRQFAEDQLVASGAADNVRTSHARYFAGRGTDVLALWDSPRQREAYEWFTIELPNLRSAFRWAADNNDIDSATAIAFCAGFLGGCLDQLEPVAWAEEMVEPAKAIGHRRLTQLYVVAVQCYQLGRIADSLRYCEEGEAALASGQFDEVPTHTEATLGIAFITAGQPERWADLSRRMIDRARRATVFTQTCLVHALTIAGDYAHAVAESQSLLAGVEDDDNPANKVHGLLAYGFANTNNDPDGAYEVLERALTISRESGNRDSETHLAVILSRLAVAHGAPTDAFEFVTIALRNFYDAGSFSLMPSPLAILAAFLDRLGHHEPAAVISGFAVNLLTPKAFPEIETAITHLREVLGEEGYESFAGIGRAMTNAEVARYAFDQIDRARAQLSQAGDSP